MTDSTRHQFNQALSEEPGGAFREFLGFLLHNKKWWMLPIVAVLALLAMLTVLSTTAAAPFIYTLF